MRHNYLFSIFLVIQAIAMFALGKFYALSDIADTAALISLATAVPMFCMEKLVAYEIKCTNDCIKMRNMRRIAGNVL